MSHLTNESDDEMPLKDQSDSASTNEGSCGRRLGALKKGPWTSSEDAILVDYVKKHGEGNWNAVQKHSGLFRCGKSCRLRWSNHLRPNLKKGTFTAEEERLIIELHAKMGNKWAQMAAHLPGRTDNEIKNYWNTRIKRRQRAGLPLYPMNVSLQALNESSHNQSVAEFSCNKTQNHNFLKGGNYDIPNIIFDNLKTAQGTLSNSPIFSNISLNSMLSLGIGSSKNYAFAHSTLHHKKYIPESETFFPGFLHPVDNFQNGTHEKIPWPFTLGSPFDADPKSKNMAPFNGAMGGSHALFNGNYSTSKFLPRAVKLELPSLQYPESDLSIPLSVEAVDTYLQSPLPSDLDISVESDCLSPRNSGLLEALLPRAIDSAKQQSSEKSSNSSSVVTPSDVIDSSTMNMCDRDWEDYGDSLSPLGCSVVSVLSECTPISGCSLDETSTTTKLLLGSDLKVEADEPISTLDNGGGKKICSRINFTMPEALRGSNLFEQKSEYATDLRMTDAIAALLGEDFSGSYKHMDFGTSSTLSQERGLGSCPWNMSAE